MAARRALSEEQIDLLVQQYKTEHPDLTLERLGERFYISRSTVAYYLTQRGVLRPAHIGRAAGLSRTRTHSWEQDDMDVIEELYYRFKLSQAEIANDLGLPQSVIARRMQRHGLRPRTKAEANKNAWLRGKKQGGHTLSELAREKIRARPRLQNGQWTSTSRTRRAA